MLADHLTLTSVIQTVGKMVIAETAVTNNQQKYLQYIRLALPVASLTLCVD